VKLQGCFLFLYGDKDWGVGRGSKSGGCRYKVFVDKRLDGRAEYRDGVIEVLDEGGVLHGKRHVGSSF
jgi:hypothetical protein